MKTKPEQLSIPGLPPPDRTKEIRAMLALHTKDAAACRKDMKDRALELADLAADAIYRMPSTPESVRKLSLEFLRARAGWIVNTEAAGRDANELRAAMGGASAQIAADVDDDFDAEEEGGEE